MIKETNKRLTITISKKQASWLKSTSKKTKMSISNLVKFLINKNLGTIIKNQFNDKELEELIKIAKTPWQD